jgi:large subunit ribosomal protein L18
VRQRVIGTAERPRLVVYRSLKHIYAQIVDDERGATVVAASDLGATLEPAAPGKEGGASGKAGVARAVGRLIAARAKEAGIRRVVFDRAGYLYHGRIKALADGARAGGLEF